MNRRLNVVVAVVAALLSSAIMRYASAQDRPAVAKEVRAQSFVLVDPANNVIGTFAAEPNIVAVVAPGTPPKALYHVALRDSTGRVIWTPENPTKLLPLSMK